MSEFNILMQSFSPEMTYFIRKHYWEVFGKSAAQVYMASVIDASSTFSFVAVDREGSRTLGGYRLLLKDYSAQILDLAVLPAARGKGLGKGLINHAKDQARAFAPRQTINIETERPKIFLDTRIYPKDSSFALFLIKMGFTAYEPYLPVLGEAEWLAYNVYKESGLYPMVFRTQLWEGSILPHAVKRELDRLTNRQCEVVLDGLDKKLGHFEKSGRLSYKYEVCPICKDVGSTLEDPKCRKCYLKLGCITPFWRGFRHDPQVGAMYFAEMRRYLWLRQ